MRWQSAGALAVVASLLAGCGGLGPSLYLGDPFPRFEATGDDGRRFTTDEAEGRPFVVHVTLTERLDAELATMANLTQEFEGSGILFLTAVLVRDGEDEQARNLLDATPRRQDWVRVLDEDGRIHQAYSATESSQVLVFGKDGLLAGMAETSGWGCLRTALDQAERTGSPERFSC